MQHACSMLQLTSQRNVTPVIQKISGWLSENHDRIRACTTNSIQNPPKCTHFVVLLDNQPEILCTYIIMLHLYAWPLPQKKE